MKNLSLAVISASVFAAVESFAGRELPYEYQELTFIQSDGVNQHIRNSGFKRTATTTKIEVDLDKPSSSTGITSVFGHEGGNGKYWMRWNGSTLQLQDEGNDASHGKFTISSGTGRQSITAVFDNEAKTSSTTHIRGEKTQTIAGKFSVYPTLDFGIFCNNDGKADLNRIYRGAFKLYSFKAWAGDVSVCDFVPCYCRATGEAGLYDISGTLAVPFVKNQNSGATVDFTRGENVYNTNRISIRHTLEYVPESVAPVPAAGWHDLLPGQPLTLRVQNPTVKERRGGYDCTYTVVGWERIVTSCPAGGGVQTTVTSNGVDDVASCTFTPAEGDEVYFKWIWDVKETELASKSQIRDADGNLLDGVYTDLAEAFAAATNNCTIEQLEDSHWNSSIEIVDKKVTLASAEGQHYTLTRSSPDAGFVIKAESTELCGPSSWYTDPSHPDRLPAHSGSYGHAQTQLTFANVTVDGGSQEGVSGGCLVSLKAGSQAPVITTGHSTYNFSSLKMTEGSEIRNFETTTSYMIVFEGNCTACRLFSGAKIHHVTGQMGVSTLPTASAIYNIVFYMEGSEIYSCRSETTPILNMSFRRLNKDKLHFYNCAITNNVCGHATHGTLYIYSNDGTSSSSSYSDFNLHGTVIVTDNFLGDGTPANVRISGSSTTGKDDWPVSVDAALGAESKIGLKILSGIGSTVEEGVVFGNVTYTKSDSNFKAFYSDDVDGFVSKREDTNLIWHKRQGLILLVR